MKCKDFNIESLSEVLNYVLSCADISSIVLTENDYVVNFSLSFSNLKEYNKQLKLEELQQFIKDY